MPARVTFSKGWDRFTRVFNRRRARRELQSQLRKKMQQQLILLRRDIIQYIDSESHGVPNSPLTKLIKGSGRPLVDHGDLRMSINWRTETHGELLSGGVGVLRTKVNRDGKKMWNVAAALHEGYVIKVTPEVRRAVFAEMRKRRGKGVQFTSSEGARTWRVKGRPFIREPFEAAEERIIVALGSGVRLTLQTL